MPRAGRWRFFAIVFLLFAGGLEPAWMVGHAVQHLLPAHHGPEEESHDSPQSSLVAVDPDHHAHPTIIVAARSALKFTPTLFAPADLTLLAVTGVETRCSCEVSPAPARASPPHSRDARPRAPPHA